MSYFQPLEKLKGIITVLNTPFTEDNHPDINSLQKNIRIAMKAGVKGFLVPAMASEAGKLTEQVKSITERVNSFKYT
jgi:dihydrodipicolinate synthase/N-acetylneuraminate lyase